MRERNSRRDKPKRVIGVCMRNEGRREIKGITFPFGDRTGNVMRLVPSFVKITERGELGTKNGVRTYGLYKEEGNGSALQSLLAWLRL